MLRDQINEAVKTAMKAQDKLRLATLRMACAANFDALNCTNTSAPLTLHSTIWLSTGLEPLLKRYNVDLENKLILGVVAQYHEDENGNPVQTRSATNDLQVDGFDSAA